MRPRCGDSVFIKSCQQPSVSVLRRRKKKSFLKFFLSLRRIEGEVVGEDGRWEDTRREGKGARRRMRKEMGDPLGGLGDFR